MATKIKINDYGDCVYSEQSVIDLIYNNPNIDISKLITDSKQYNNALQELGLNFPKFNVLPEHKLSVSDYDKKNYMTWHMPKAYEDINLKTYLLEKCNTAVEKKRVSDELVLFEQKGFLKVLQFLIYFVDTLRQNNVVWGVGRGSSVSSFCLFLIGVHKINPLLYNLDYAEFLR